MSETESKKRGFFSKLFGLDQPETRPPEPVPAAPPERPAEPEAEVAPEAEPEAPLAPEILLGEEAPLPIVAPEAAQPKRSWWRRLLEGWKRTSGGESL